MNIQPKALELMRRSTRLQLQVRVHVRSLNPAVVLDEECETLIVNLQGCALKCSKQLPPGLRLGVTVSGHTAEAIVANCTKVAEGAVVGVQLTRPANIWGVTNPPLDWVEPVPQVAPEAAAPPAKEMEPMTAIRTQVPTASTSNAALPGEANALKTLFEQYCSRFEALANEVRAGAQSHLAEEWMAWCASVRDGLTSIEGELRKKLNSEGTRWIEETRRACDSLEELVRRAEVVAPLIEQQLGSIPSVEEMAGQVKQELMAAQESLRALAMEQEFGVRVRLVQEFEQKSRELLATADAAGLRIAAAEGILQLAAERLASELHRKTEESMAGLRVQVGTLVAQHEQELSQRLTSHYDGLIGTLDAAASAQVQQVAAAAAKVLPQLEAFPPSAEEARQAVLRAAEAALEDIDGRRARLEGAISQQAETSLAVLGQALQQAQQQLEAALQKQGWEYDALAESASAKLKEHLATTLQLLNDEAQQKKEQLSAIVQREAAAAREEARAELQADTERHRQAISSAAAAESAGLRARMQQHFAEQEAALAARREALHAASAELEARQRQVSGQLEQVEETRRQVEILLASLPAKISAHAEEAAQRVTKRIIAESEQRIKTTVQQQVQDDAQRLTQLLSNSAERLREQLAEQAQQKAVELQATLMAWLESRQNEASLALDLQAGELQSRTAEAVRSAEASMTANVQAAKAASAGLESRLSETAAGLEGRLRGAAAEQSDALLRQLEDAKAWLDHARGQFLRSMQDALDRANRDFEQRVAGTAQASEAAVQGTAKEALATFEAAARQQAAAMERSLRQQNDRLAGLSRENMSAAEAQLQARMAEALAQFETDAARLAQSAVTRWQAAMVQSVRTLPDLMRARLEEDESAPKARAASGGEGT